MTEHSGMTVEEKEVFDVGQCLIQARQDEIELERVNRCAKNLAEKLQVVIDCLDPSNTEVKAMSFPKEGVFTSHQPADSNVSLSTVPNTGLGHGFDIPEQKVVEYVLKQVHDLENSIRRNKERAEKEIERQARGA